MKVEIIDLRKEFEHSKRGSLLALDRVRMEVASGEFVSIVGSSGCGKTTLLEIIAGLQEKTGGEILIEGIPIEKSPANRAIVFQHYALFPWLTVQKNIEYGPRIRGIDRKERKRICRKYTDIVGLNGFEKYTPMSFQEACNSASRWQEHLQMIPIYCCWMNLSRHWILKRGRTANRNSSACGNRRA
jgi:ABC-type nitrate/sulfonate/bicarbonate transport system ATPase subunit